MGAATAIALLLLVAYMSEVDAREFHVNPTSPRTIGVVGFKPWIPKGFSVRSASVSTDTRLPAGVRRYPELILMGSYYKLPLEIHEYRQTHAIGQSDLFVDDPRVVRLVPIWPADHALVDKNGLLVGFLIQRGSLHIDLHLATGISPKELQLFAKQLLPHT